MDAGEAFICAGVESMTPRADDGLQPDAQSRRWPSSYPAAYMAMGEHRRESGAASTRSPAPSRKPSPSASHRKAAAAQRAGRFDGRNRADP